MIPESKSALCAWMPVVLLCAAIFIQSCFSVPDIGPPFPFQDKMMHMAAYGVLAVLFCRACGLTWPMRFSRPALFAISIVFATLYGVSDELHQSFVATRQADTMDLLADFVGSVSGVSGYLLINRQWRGK